MFVQKGERVALPLACRNVGFRHPGGVDGSQHPNLRTGVAESPVVLAQRRTRAVNDQGKDGCSGFDRQTERAVLEGAHLAVGTSGALGEDHHRHLAIQPGFAHLQRRRAARSIPTNQRDVAGHLHHPTHEWDVEDGLLAQPLHLDLEMADEEHVDEALVVRS